MRCALKSKTRLYPTGLPPIGAGYFSIAATSVMHLVVGYTVGCGAPFQAPTVLAGDATNSSGSSGPSREPPHATHAKTIHNPVTATSNVCARGFIPAVSLIWSTMGIINSQSVECSVFIANNGCLGRYGASAQMQSSCAIDCTARRREHMAATTRDCPTLPFAYRGSNPLA